MKLNDYFLNVLANPGFNTLDFSLIGLDADNTEIKDKSYYENKESVRENLLFQKDGNFNKEEFDRVYDYALASYNILANKSLLKNLDSSYEFFRNDIYASNRKDSDKPEYAIVDVNNPFRLKTSLSTWGILDDPDKSIREIAQTLKYWNPLKLEWEDAPNDSFWNSFINPKALAQWDYDADKNGNPTTDKSKIVFHKGELKLNQNGTYYYEPLNGRSPHNREMLKVWDILTTDGSKANKYDFFDSDDLEKSYGGTMARLVVKVVPYFIPVVNEIYIPIRIGLELTGLFAKVGKTLVGSDNTFLNNLEGWSDSMEFSQSDYAKGSTEMGIEAHPWGMENLLVMGSDVFAQLAEQRWLFKYAGRLLPEGKLGFLKKIGEKTEYQEKWLNDFVSKRDASLTQAIERKLKYLKENNIKAITNPAELASLYKAHNIFEAKRIIDKAISRNQKFGAEISKLYMTGITTADAYSEAKEAGVEDLPAALFAFGYALGEYGILSTDLGKWILPELRMLRTNYKDIARILAGTTKDLNKSTNPGKVMSTILRILKLGKSAATAEYANVGLSAKDTAKALVANALGEGVEETTEELLADMSKVMYNGLSKYFGDKNHIQTNWEDSEGNFNLTYGLNDYALNFVGGVIGGGLGEALPEFRNALRYSSRLNDPNISPELKRREAYEELVGIIRSGLKKLFLNTMNKMLLDNPYLSSELADNLNTSYLESSLEETGIFKPGTPENNRDLDAKRNLTALVDNIENILNVTLKGLSVDDATFLDIQIANDLRMDALRESATAASWIQDFNSELSKITEQTLELQALTKQLNDNPDDEVLKQKHKQLTSSIKESLKIIDEYRLGKRSALFKEQALFEMNQGLSDNYTNTTFIQYAEAVTGQNIEDISDKLLEVLKTEWDSIANMQKKDKVKLAFKIFKAHNIALSELFKKNGFSRILDFKSFINQFIKLDSDYHNYLINLGFDNPDLIQDIQNYERSTKSNFNVRRYFLLSVINAMFTGELLSKYLSIIDLNPTTPEELEQLLENVNAAIVEIFTDDNNIQHLEQLLNNTTFIDPDTKYLINSMISSIGSSISEVADNADSDEEEELYRNYANKIFNLSNLVNEKYSTPILLVADLFAIDTNRQKLSEILNEISTLYRLLAITSNLENFGVGDYIDKINNAITLLNQLESSIIAMRTDAISYKQIAGYNATMNEINGNLDLATMDRETAEKLLLDLKRVKSELSYFKKIWNYNTDSKLSAQTRLHAKTAYQFYNKALRIIKSIMPDDVKGLEELLALLEGSLFLSSHSNDTDYSLSIEDQILLEKELIAIYDALGDFINNNLDNLDKIINLDIFNIFQKNDGEVSFDNNNEMDDSAFIWKLYTLASLRASNFYNNLKELANQDVALIPSLEDVDYANIAFLTDKTGLYEKFKDLLNTQIGKKIETFSDEDKRRLLSEHGLNLVDPKDNDNYIAFSNVFFNEGDPGTGKTFAVDRLTVSYLNQFHKEIADNIIVLSNTKTNAEKLAQGLGYDDVTGHAFTVDEFLTRIAPGYTREFDSETGDIKIDSARLHNDDGILKYNHTVVEGGFKDKNDKNPSLVLIDEATLVSKLDLHKIDEWLNLVKAKAIISGDFNLLGITGTYKYEDSTYTSYLHRNMFARTLKLGESIRTENSAKDLNNKIAKAQLTGEHASKPLSYYLDDSGLYGDVIYTKDRIEDIKNTINIMLDSLGDKESITYLYDDDTNVLLNEIQKLKELHPDKINILKASASLGGEGQYYIIDLSQKDLTNKDAYFRKFYTALTRGKLGSLIIGTKELSSKFSGTIKLNVKPSRFSFSPELKEVYSKQRVAILSADGVLNPVNSSKKLSKEDNDDSHTDSINNNDGELFDDVDNGDVKKEISQKRTESVHVPENKENDPNHLYMIMHTGLLNQIGGIIEGDRISIHRAKWALSRIDGINGLYRLGLYKLKKEGEKFYLVYNNGEYVSPNSVISILKNIQYASLIEKDKSKIEQIIKTTLEVRGAEDVEDIKIRYAYKHIRVKGVGTGKFAADLNKEKQYGDIDGENALKSQRHGIYAEIYVKRNDSNKYNLTLEVPIMSFTSPLSMLSVGPFKLAFESILKQTGKEREALELAITMSNGKYKNFEEAALALYLAGYENDFVVFLDNIGGELFIPGKYFLVTPPTVSSKSRGDEEIYFRQGYNWENKWMSLNEIKERLSWRFYSENVFAPLDEDIKRGDTIVVPKGQMFVLVTDYDIGGTTDEQLMERFKYELSHPEVNPTVSALLVVPPTATIREYLENLNKVYSRKADVKPDKAVGTQISIVHIANAVLGKGKFEGTEFKVDGQSVRDWYLSSEKGNGDGSRTTEIETVEKILDKLNRLSNSRGYTKEALDFLDEYVEVNGKKGRIKNKAYLVGFVREIVQSYWTDEGDIKYNLTDDESAGIDNPNNRINALQQLLESKGINGIFYHIDMSTKTIGGYNTMNVENGMFRRQDIMVNVRPDPAMLIGDALPLIKLINQHTDGDLNVEYELGIYNEVENTLDINQVVEGLDLPNEIKLFIKNNYPSDLEVTKENVINWAINNFNFNLSEFVLIGDKVLKFSEAYNFNIKKFIAKFDNTTAIGIDALTKKLTIYKVINDSETEIITLKPGDLITLNDGTVYTLKSDFSIKEVSGNINNNGIIDNIKSNLFGGSYNILKEEGNINQLTEELSLSILNDPIIGQNIDYILSKFNLNYPPEIETALERLNYIFNINSEENEEIQNELITLDFFIKNYIKDNFGITITDNFKDYIKSCII